MEQKHAHLKQLLINYKHSLPDWYLYRLGLNWYGGITNTGLVERTKISVSHQHNYLNNH